MDGNKPRRRWFRFSLRTLFVLVTTVACVVGWVVYQLDWIRQRRAIFYDDPRWSLSRGASAPNLLWIFGERGYQEVTRMVHVEHGNQPPPGIKEEMDLIQVLFPEASISWAVFSMDAGPFPETDDPIPARESRTFAVTSYLNFTAMGLLVMIVIVTAAVAWSVYAWRKVLRGELKPRAVYLFWAVWIVIFLLMCFSGWYMKD